MRTVSSTAAAGIREAERRFERAATDIAKETTSSSNERMDVVELSEASERPDVAGLGAEVSETTPSVLDSIAAEASTDLATSFVSMSQAKAAFSANLAVLRTADETERSLLDVQG